MPYYEMLGAVFNLAASIMKKYLFVAISLLFSQIALAQINYFKNIGAEEGLDQGFVYAISKGPKGYLWLGTSNGFKRYNGRQIYSTSHLSLPQQNASASLLSSDSVLWLGFFDGTIAKVVHGDSALVYDDIFSEKVSAVVESEYGAVFFIGQQGSIGRYFNGNFTIMPPPEEGLFFYDALHFSKTDFYVASEKGLLAVEFNSTSYQYTVAYESAVLSLCKKGNQLFAGSRNGIITQSINKEEDFLLRKINAAVNDLLIDSLGHLWAATNGTGLLRFKKAEQLSGISSFNRTSGLSSDYLVSLGLDREGNIWAGTAGDGLCMFINDAFAYQHKNIAKEGINTLSSNGQGLWVGTNAGLFYVQKDQVATYLSGQVITAVHQDSSGNIWVGVADSGLRLKKKNASRFETVSLTDWPEIDIVNSIDTDSSGHIWIATRLNGLLRLSPNLDDFEQYGIANGLPHNNIYQALCGKDGKVWVGSSAAGVGYLKDGDYFPLQLNEQLNRFEVKSLLESANGDIWLGSNGGGLFKYTQDSVVHFTEKNGLLSSYINMLGQDAQNNLWIGTSQGIHIWDEALNNKRSYATSLKNWQSFKVRAHIFTVTDQYVWLGTDAGLLQFDASKEQAMQVAPLVHLIDAELDGASVLNNKNLSLPYGDYRLKLEFEAIYFGIQQDVAYRYQLSGFENNWSAYSERNFAEYPKLSAGNYELLLQAKTSDKLQSNVASPLKLDIAKPFWQQLWFYLIASAVLLVTGFSIHQYRLQRLRRANKMLSLKVAEKTKALAEEKDKLEEAYKKLVQLEEFKESMNSMIVHDLKNPLNLVIALSDEKSQVYEAGRQMLNMVLNILDVNRFEEAKVALSLQKIKLAALVQNAIEQVSIIVQQKQIKIENDFHEGLVVEVDADIATRVMVNLLSNAVKYSPAGSKITISATKEEQRVKISVADTGYGISQKEIPFIFDKFRQADNHSEMTMRSSGLGLTFCKLAVEAHDGEIGVESEEGQGSVFSFSVMGEEALSQRHQPKVKPIEEHIALNKSDLYVLNAFKQNFNGLEVYDTSKNLELIASIPSETDTIKSWKEALKQAVIAFNESNYRDLLQQLKQVQTNNKSSD